MKSIDMKSIDLNCDMGESFGPWPMGNDTAVLPWISSASIACGYHAGDAPTMHATAAAAQQAGVAIGAHVGLPDLAGFGRRRMAVSAGEVHAMTLAQAGAMQAMARSVGARLCHVKPHGALYHMLEEDAALADAFVAAVRDTGPSLRVFGLAGGQLVALAKAAGLPVAGEGFVDRRYLVNGRLAPRSSEGAVLTDPHAVAEQAVTIAVRGKATSSTGTDVVIVADTLCLHGDRDAAAELARTVHHALKAAGVTIQAPASIS